MAVGIGFDIHRLEEGGPLRLGGIDIEHSHRACGHSDGDVVLHALVDALLGAGAGGDIGEAFSDSDPANKDRDSREFVEEVWKSAGRTWRLINVDITVMLEAPRLGGNKERMRREIAEMIGTDPGRINVKAKSFEGLGEIGRGEAVAAQAVVQLEPR